MVRGWVRDEEIIVSLKNNSKQQLYFSINGKIHYFPKFSIFRIISEVTNININTIVD